MRKVAVTETCFFVVLFKLDNPHSHLNNGVALLFQRLDAWHLKQTNLYSILSTASGGKSASLNLGRSTTSYNTENFTSDGLKIV